MHSTVARVLFHGRLAEVPDGPWLTLINTENQIFGTRQDFSRIWTNILGGHRILCCELKKMCVLSSFEENVCPSAFLAVPLKFDWLTGIALNGHPSDKPTSAECPAGGHGSNSHDAVRSWPAVQGRNKCRHA
jgi:hypothetical protein